MVQIIEGNRSNIFDALLGGANQIMQKRAENEKMRKENETLKKLGVEVEGIRDPNLRKLLLEGSQKQQAEQAKNQQSAFEDTENYKKIEGMFGKSFADTWKAAPTGGRTELLKAGLDAKIRGIDIDEMLGGMGVNPGNESTQMNQEKMQSLENPSDELHPKEIPQFQKGQIPKDYDYPNFDRKPFGYTPKEWQDEKKTWRKENEPVFKETTTKLSNAKRDAVDIKKLEQLNKSPNLPKDFQRLLINPDTNDFYTPAKVLGFQSPEAEEWSKVIARFGNRAKDAYGSRVTNFDLVQYMRQFPSLLNSTEGRDRILKMMNINNKLDELHADALKQVYKKYGLTGIPQEEADRIAEDIIKEDTERLRNEYLAIDEKNQEGAPNDKQQMTERPSPQENMGRTITDTSTGKKYKSDGTNWILVR